uniref:Uncharacterized protein n=1 Tax=Hucho hucho TaxID=62062 RepID=A0A4W5LUH0_9TELE
MQELMSRHKTYSLSPRDCLKTCLFQKWQRMVAPPAEPARQAPNKRRKRKMSGGSTMSAGGGTTNNNKKKSPASSFPLSSQVPVSSSQINHVYFRKPVLHQQLSQCVAFTWSKTSKRKPSRSQTTVARKTFL